MKWIDSNVVFDEEVDAKSIISLVERACRTCYQSLDKIEEGSAERLIRNCISRGHESVLEHGKVTFRITCDRAIMAEITRHRIASYSIESTRYCAYNKEKFGKQLTFIYPSWYDEQLRNAVSNFEPLTMAEQDKVANFGLICDAARHCEETYFDLLEGGATPEIARAVLPNCLKTEIVMTMNMRELRSFLRLRSSAAAHPDIRIIANKMLELLRTAGLGVFFEDIKNV